MSIHVSLHSILHKPVERIYRLRISAARRREIVSRLPLDDRRRIAWSICPSLGVDRVRRSLSTRANEVWRLVSAFRRDYEERTSIEGVISGDRVVLLVDHRVPERLDTLDERYVAILGIESEALKNRVEEIVHGDL